MITLLDRLHKFKVIPLFFVKQIKLMKRTETKYVCTFNQMLQILDEINDYYYIQSNDGKLISKYKTLYFDTPDLNLYKDHCEGKQKRHKVRIREYDNGTKFLEIKEKENGITNKKRINIKSYNITDKLEWIDSNLEYDSLNIDTKTETEYTRITLVNLDKTERVTIDFNIVYHNFLSDKRLAVTDIVFEIKSNEENSYIKSIFDKMNIIQAKYSKYKHSIEI